METQRRFSFSAEQHSRLCQHIQTVLELLDSLHEDNVGTSKRQEVCPEEYIGKAIGFPFYRLGFRTVDCDDFIPIHQLVTIVLNTPEELSKPAQSYMEILQGVAQYYPKVQVIMVTKEKIEQSKMKSISKLNIDFKNIQDSQTNEGNLWYKIVQRVQTPYVLIAPHVTHFDDDVILERLVRVLSYNRHIGIAGGSYRNLTGHWDIGCQQVSFRNWTATYKGGYYLSLNECVVCDFLAGPWMAKTKLLKNLQFDYSLKNGAFHDIFFRLKKNPTGELAVSCPDVMFNIQTHDVQDRELLDFAIKHKIHKIVEPNWRVHWYGCRHGHVHTSHSLCAKKNGITLSPSDMENLADMVKFAMSECENAGVFCEVSDGTLLGAVKFSGILPWERDADMVFQLANGSALKNLRGKFEVQGFTFHVKNDGRKFELRSETWKVELWGFNALESEEQISRGQHPTRVYFDGQWVVHPRNPGLYARNRYGHEIYRHQQHWMTLGLKSSWQLYNPGKFPGCPEPGHSACLDQYPGDGNMQFKNYPP